MDKKQKLAIVVIVAVTALLSGVVFMQGGKSSSTEGHAQSAQGHEEEKEHKDGEHHGAAATADHKDKDEHADGEHHQASPAKGLHGGSLFSEASTAVEVVLAEDSDGARLIVYPLDNGKPVVPQSVQLTAVLTRPLQEPEKIPFEIAKDALRSAVTIDEPHLFDINVEVLANGKKMHFVFSKEEGKIELSAAQIKSAAIEIKTAASVRLNSGLQLPGEIRFNADRTAHVVPQVAGVVDAVSANLGQAVKKGQLLAVISSSAVSELRSEQLNAQQRLVLAQSTYSREKKLWEEKISAEQDYLQAQQTLREAEIAVRNTQQKLRAVGASSGASSGSLSRYEVRAPFDGVVVEKHLSLGESVKEDSNIFTVSDLSTVWAEIIVSPQHMNIIKVGETAVVKATAFDAAATGKISYLGAFIGEQTRTAKAHIILQNPANTWRPGLFVNVEVSAGQADVPVAIATDAVQLMDGKNIVFVQIPGGFMAQEVTLGRTDGKQVEIKDGIKAGTPYAASGSFAIKAELGKGSAEHAY
jgi:membrane fusion protein, heavy metal efflux system